MKNDLQNTPCALLLIELLSQEQREEWGFGACLVPDSSTSMRVPTGSGCASIQSLYIHIPYFTGYFRVDFGQENVELFAVDQKTPADRYWLLDTKKEWWGRARLCSWPMYIA